MMLVSDCVGHPDMLRLFMDNHQRDLLLLALAHVDQSWNHWFCGSFSRCFFRDDDVTSFPTMIPLFKWQVAPMSFKRPIGCIPSLVDVVYVNLKLNLCSVFKGETTSSGKTEDEDARREVQSLYIKYIEEWLHAADLRLGRSTPLD